MEPDNPGTLPLLTSILEVELPDSVGTSVIIVVEVVSSDDLTETVISFSKILF